MNDKPLLQLISAGLLALIAANGYAKPFEMPKTQASMETCLNAALNRQDGRAVTLEFKSRVESYTYEVEIVREGQTMEFQCDAGTGKITGQAQEFANPRHPVFNVVAKVGLLAAEMTARQAVPGKVLETEFEIQSNGAPAYEFNIETDQGTEMKVEVNAATGTVIGEAEKVIYQIGGQ